VFLFKVNRNEKKKCGEKKNHDFAVFVTQEKMGKRGR